MNETFELGLDCIAKQRIIHNIIIPKISTITNILLKINFTERLDIPLIQDYNQF